MQDQACRAPTPPSLPEREEQRRPGPTSEQHTHRSSRPHPRRPSLQITTPGTNRLPQLTQQQPQQANGYGEIDFSQRPVASRDVQGWPRPVNANTREPNPVPVQQPRASAQASGSAAEGTELSVSQTNIHGRGHRAHSESFISKLPTNGDAGGRFSNASRTLPSIFPTYDPEVPLNQQAYGPAHTPVKLGPIRIPRAAISRQSYYDEPTAPESRNTRVYGRASTGNSQIAGPGTTWPPQPAVELAAEPETCTTEQLKSLWRAINGSKASPSEGRIYRLSMTRARDAPVYTLSSASSQPLYILRLDPTSTSAYVTLTRHDPSKPCKVPDRRISSSSISNGDGKKHWQEALTTTLEEESRRHHPNDGLVALLMPTPATRMAVEKSDDPVAVAMAESECARLVYDEDTAKYFLVHEALATPFCVAIEGSPAYSRVEYTLEHHESPRHLAKLMRDGTGGGWVEIDTLVASLVDSCYIIDVAVTALLLVAASDDKNLPAPLETFEPPPPAVLAGTGCRDAGRLGKLSIRRDYRRGKKSGKMETFEMDVESQAGSVGKARRKEDAENKRPLMIRIIVKLAKGGFKCVLCMLTIAVKCVAGLCKLVGKCAGSK
ncbi:hypothetical protein RJ55_04801 [Drechmeria coniospora]|nr:hypothetical protein RJ55_04801 [Drechmeria coniospora]